MSNTDPSQFGPSPENPATPHQPMPLTPPQLPHPAMQPPTAPAHPGASAPRPAAHPLPTQWSAMAVTGFVLSVLGFFVPFASLVSIVFSAVGLSATSNNARRGRALASWGLAMGIISCTMGAIFGVIAVTQGSTL